MRKSERSVEENRRETRRERFETMHHDESVRSPFLHHTDVTSHETTTLKPDDDDDAARGWTPREDSSSFATQKHAMRHFPRYFYHIVDALNSC